MSNNSIQVNKTLRLFFCIPIPNETGQQLLDSFPGKPFFNIRFQPAAQLHVTVHFLGSTPPEQVEDIIAGASAILATVSAFTMWPAAFGILPDAQHPKMIWAALHEHESFEKLVLRFRHAFPTGEDRKPQPHITLARIRQMRQLPFAIPEIPSFELVVKEIRLMQSHTLPQGAVYEQVHAWLLK